MTLANASVAAPVEQAPLPGAPAAGTVVGRYRKRPVEIEAIRYDGANSEDVARWTNAFTEDVIRPTEHWCGQCGHDDHADNRDLLIATLEDGTPGAAQVDHIAVPGDWIVRGIHGEFYPVKDAVFRATYEAVSR